MKAAILHIVGFGIILLGMMLLADADVLSSCQSQSTQRQQELPFRSASFLKEAQSSEARKGVLLTKETEQHLQEETRSCLKLGGLAAGLKHCSFISLLPLKEKRLKGSAFLFAGAVPIYLQVLCLRL